MLSDNRAHGPAPVCRTNLTTLILRELRDYVVAQGLCEGDRLPPERELAMRLNVSRPTLRSALQWLAQRGALRRVQGGGTFLEPNFLAVLVEAPAYEPDMPNNLSEVVEARSVLEPAVVQLATRRMTRDELASLEAVVQKEAECLDDPQAWRQQYLHFHLRLTRLCGNSILADALQVLFAPMLSLLMHPDIDIAECHNQHRAMVEAMAHGDGEAAAQQMRRHLEMLSEAAKGPMLRVSA